jgi:hypothetical protein
VRGAKILIVQERIFINADKTKAKHILETKAHFDIPISPHKVEIVYNESLFAKRKPPSHFVVESRKNKRTM